MKLSQGIKLPLVIIIICIYTQLSPPNSASRIVFIIKFHQITGLLLLLPKVCFLSSRIMVASWTLTIFYTVLERVLQCSPAAAAARHTVVQSHDSSSVVQVIVRSRRFFIHLFSIKTRVRVGRKQLSIYIRTALLTIHDWYESFF